MLQYYINYRGTLKSPYNAFRFQAVKHITREAAHYGTSNAKKCL